MTERYLLLSLIAVIAYSLVAPLVKLGMQTIPSTAAVFLSNSVVLLILGLILLYRQTSPISYFTHRKTPLIGIWGVILAVGLLSYYRALALGPVSIVVPIYGLFIVGGSIIGIAFFEESLIGRKALSLVLALLAITLMSV